MAWDGTNEPRGLGLGAGLLLLAAAPWALPGCTTATAEGAQIVDAQKARVSTAAPTPAGSATQPAQPPPRPRARLADSAAAETLYYDLAAHRADAEVFQGAALVADFGGPGDAKYTLGGWGTRVRGAASVDGVGAALVRGTHGDLIIPVPFDGGATVRLQLRAPRDGEVTAYLGDTVVARVKTDKSQFNTVRIDLPPERAPRGEHLLRLRASGLAPLGRESVAVAVDWLTVAPLGSEDVKPLLSTPSSNPQELSMPAGQTLGFAFRVPANARFGAELTGQAGARLQVSVTGDDLQESSLGEYGPGKVALDLSSLAGKVVRLNLKAESAVALLQPRVSVPQIEAPRKLEKPVRNVLVYLIDTLRADHLKPFNAGTRVRTPGLDELVSQGGAVFASAHTQENWTKPSVATLLSSLMPWEHHATTTEAVVPSEVRLLPELLQERGFHTGAFIANGYVSDKFGFKQGFHSFRNYIREGRYSRAEFLAADVVEWLDKRPAKDPFFLYVHAIDPHVPYKPTGEFLSVYDPLPYDGVVDFSHDNELLEKIKIGSIKLNGRDKQHLEALYDSEISYHDVHFRAILTALEKRQLADDTMIVVVADHGEEFWDHGSVGHGHSVYEELLRIPMVMRVPGLTRTAAPIATSAGLVDVVPTVLEALGQELPGDLSGRSLLSELAGGRADAPPAVVSGFMDGWRTVVVGDLKLIQRTEKRVMLHDLAEDPHEQVDVVGKRPISTRYLRGQLGLALARSQPGEAAAKGKQVHREQKTEIDAATEAQLRALGYVGSSRR
jgi:choline-sulfatase